MKKKVLFVMESLGIGGAEKSLVTLLSQFDYSKYEVDLFLFNPKGEFIDLLPSEVNLLKTPEDFKNYISSPRYSINYLYKNKKWQLLIPKLMELSMLSIYRFIFKKEYIGWKYIKQSIKTLPIEYDVAIGFLEKKSIYFIVDRVIAKKKIGWIHTDYKNIDYNYNTDNKHFRKLNHLVTVSESCKNTLIDIFPHYRSRIEVIKNIISPILITRMADEKIQEVMDSQDGITICTIGRLTEAKGYDIAIQCCEKLIEKGINHKWFVVGEGSERTKLQAIIEEKGLRDTFILIGSRTNPYPYIKQCDIYIQPSRWEGYGITVAEAKVLNKPIVVSNIPEFLEQIESNKTGLVYSSIEEMVSKVEILISDNKARARLINNLKNMNISMNNEELEKLENLF